eukprot:579304_1
MANQIASTRKASQIASSQIRYTEYEIDTISWYEGLTVLTTKELAFYNRFNAILPTIQEKKAFIVDNEEQLLRSMRDYNLLLFASHKCENQMESTNIEVSIAVDLLWRTHLLSTTHYYTDCMEKFGQLINYKHYNTHSLTTDSTQFQKTLLDSINTNDVPHKLNNIISIELHVFKRMLQEYCLFITRVGELNLSNNPFDVNKAIVRYRYFMYLKHITCEDRATLRLVPTSDILFLWYCHIIYLPSIYLEFSRTLLNQDSMLRCDFFWLCPIQNSDVKETSALWNTHFGIRSYVDYAFDNFIFDAPRHPRHAKHVQNINQKRDYLPLVYAITVGYVVTVIFICLILYAAVDVVWVLRFLYIAMPTCVGLIALVLYFNYCVGKGKGLFCTPKSQMVIVSIVYECIVVSICIGIRSSVDSLWIILILWVGTCLLFVFICCAKRKPKTLNDEFVAKDQYIVELEGVPGEHQRIEPQNDACIVNDINETFGGEAEVANNHVDDADVLNGSANNVNDADIVAIVDKTRDECKDNDDSN